MQAMSLRRRHEARERPALRLVRDGEVPRPSPDTASKRAPHHHERAGHADGTRLMVLTFSLTAFGLITVLSASSAVSILDYGSPWALFERQVLWTAIGLGAFLFASRIDLMVVRRVSTFGLVAVAVLLVAVLAPHLGKTSGGSSRWIGFGPITIQPSEFAKLAFSLFAADLVARREKARNQLSEIVRPLGIVAVFLGILILKQPDMGTAIVIVVIAAAVLFAGGVRTRLLGTIVSAATLCGGVLVLAAPYRRARLFSFINPFAHASTTGYQVVQGLVALGSGGTVGVGLGASDAKWFLPNAQTDFIFAVIGNELGFVGAAIVLLCFGAFAWFGVRIAARALTRYESLLAVAITCWITFEALINIGGVVGVLPETGIPLPFLSFGGSSLVVALCATGLLVNIARRSDARRRGIEGTRRRTRTG